MYSDTCIVYCLLELVLYHIVPVRAVPCVCYYTLYILYYTQYGIIFTVIYIFYTHRVYREIQYCISNLDILDYIDIYYRYTRYTSLDYI